MMLTETLSTSLWKWGTAAGVWVAQTFAPFSDF